jgi:glycosyltransferase involved in cell wall biosynthesis
VLATLLICTRDRAEALDQTLAALTSVARPRELDVELIVVDNGSSDATPQVVARHHPFLRPIIYLHEPKGGKSVALNTGLARSTGEIIVLTDDDVRPSPQWLIELTQGLASRRSDAVSGHVTIAPHLRRDWMKPIHAAWLAATDNLDFVSPETAVGANMAFRRGVLERVSGFDPELGPGRLGLWEDTLFCLQLRQAGFQLEMARTATVEHHFGESRLKRGAFLSRGRAEARSSAYVAWHWKHENPSAPRTRMARWYLHLAIKRVTRWSEWHTSEGMPEWELNLLTGIEFERHFMVEQRRTRRYSRLGTTRAHEP